MEADYFCEEKTAQDTDGNGCLYTHTYKYIRI